LHVGNVFKEGELTQASTVKEYLTVQQEGKRNVSRNVKYYNLDVIISVGYRVKSKRSTDFRIWARQILKDYLVKGYAVNQRIHREQIGELRQLVSMLGRVHRHEALSTEESEALPKYSGCPDSDDCRKPYRGEGYYGKGRGEPYQ